MLVLQYIIEDSELQTLWFSRILAALVDWILVGIFVRFFMFFVPLNFIITYGILLVLYFTYCESKFKETFGKSLFRLYVTGNTDIKNTFIRNLTKVNFFILLIEFLITLFTEGDPRQRLLERYAGTTVVGGIGKIAGRKYTEIEEKIERPVERRVEKKAEKHIIGEETLARGIDILSDKRLQRLWLFAFMGTGIDWIIVAVFLYGLGFLMDLSRWNLYALFGFSTLAYLTLFDGMFKTSIGKNLLGIRVGGDINLKSAFVRNIGKVHPYLFFIELIVSLFIKLSPGQTILDNIANTNFYFERDVLA